MQLSLLYREPIRDCTESVLDRETYLSAARTVSG